MEMMFLVDTNIWLERLLKQEKSKEVKIFLDAVPSVHLSISDFAYHSVGVITSKLGKEKSFVEFTDDLFVKSSVSLLRLAPEEMYLVAKAIHEKKFDFDDAYQYVISSLYPSEIVSFDKGFIKKGIKTLTPAEALAKYLKGQ